MSSKKYNILYVDDEKNNLIVFNSTFFKDYQVFTTTSAEEGLQIIRQHPIHLVLCDQRMPGMSGVEFLEIIASEYPQMVRIIITAYADVDIVINAINRCGIYHYILKPWDLRELKITIQNAISKCILENENQRLISELKLHNEQLEEKVRTRTAELVKANRELEETNKIKDKLFSVISHDLMTPIFSFSIFLDVILKLQNDLSLKKVKAYSSKIRNYVQNVMDMLENLLNWSVSQMGRIKNENKPLALEEVLQKNFNLFELLAEQKGIDFKLNTPEKKVTVLGDENMINIVIRNLISNAIKYTASKGKIVINTQLDDRQAIISIADSGLGINPDKLQSLFDKNYIKPEPGVRLERGTGIGLKLCKEFVEKLNGQIWAESTEGKGSTFYFSLPITTRKPMLV